MPKAEIHPDKQFVHGKGEEDCRGSMVWYLTKAGRYYVKCERCDVIAMDPERRTYGKEIV